MVWMSDSVTVEMSRRNWNRPGGGISLVQDTHFADELSGTDPDYDLYTEFKLRAWDGSVPAAVRVPKKWRQPPGKRDEEGAGQHLGAITSLYSE